MPGALVEMSGIRRSFGPQEVLAGVDLDVRTGEVHVLAGENGAGKSTLIRILGGVLRADAGEIRVDGRTVRLASAQDAARAGIAVIHQELSLCPALSVADNLALGREPVTRLGTIRRRLVLDRARTALGRVGLDVDPRREAGSLPIAARQLVEIAKALALDARVIVMDEPTSSLARADADRLFHLIDEMTRAGAGIVFISHRLEEIRRVATRVTVLRDGVVTHAASADETPNDVLIRAMVGRPIEDQVHREAPEPGDVLLRLRDVSAGARTGVRVEHITLDLRAGEVLGVAGLRGSGTTELLHALFGDLPVRSGAIELDRVPHHPRTPGAAVRARVALVTGDRQALGVCPGLSIMENVTLASLDTLGPAGFVSDRTGHARARDAVDELRIRCRSTQQPVATLSGGNQQKVVLARWTRTDPLVMLMDDPTRGVDIGAKHEIYQLINAWTARGIGVVLASTDLPELVGLADRMIVLHRGRITATLTRDETTPERVMSAAMGDARRGAA